MVHPFPFMATRIKGAVWTSHASVQSKNASLVNFHTTPSFIRSQDSDHFIPFLRLMLACGQDFLVLTNYSVLALLKHGTEDVFASGSGTASND